MLQAACKLDSCTKLKVIKYGVMEMKCDVKAVAMLEPIASVWETETREVISEFGLLGMKLARKTKDNYLNVRERLFRDVSRLLKNNLSMIEFEAMSKIKLFGPSFLIGGAVKWYNPSALEDIAETLGMKEEYLKYIKLFKSYIAERSVHSDCDGKLHVFTDKEWWTNGIEDVSVDVSGDLSDVIGAVEEHFSKEKEDIKWHEDIKHTDIDAKKGIDTKKAFKAVKPADQNAKF